MMADVRAADLAALLREVFEEMIQPHRRASGWEAKWQEIEEWADALDDGTIPL